MQEIINTYRGKIRAIIKKMTGSYNEDIEQEVYIKTWRGFSKYKENGKLGQWIGAITANVCRDYFKSRQTQETQQQNYDEEVLENIPSSEDRLNLLKEYHNEKNSICILHFSNEFFSCRSSFFLRASALFVSSSPETRANRKTPSRQQCCWLCRRLNRRNHTRSNYK